MSAVRSLQARAAAERVAASFHRTSMRSLDEAFATAPVDKLREEVVAILDALLDEIEGQAQAAIDAEGQIVEERERVAELQQTVTALEAQIDRDRLRLLEASVAMVRQ